MKQCNYHTHTWRCNHATGSDEAYVLEAIANNYERLGFSDHACWQYASHFKPHIRMELKEFHSYKKSIHQLKEQYKDQIEILLGMEAEYFPEYMDWMLDFCIEEGIDYLIFGNHYYQSDETHIYFGSTQAENISKYFDTIIEGLETGMYSYLAHPELIMRNSYLEFDDTIIEGFHRVCRYCKEHDIPLEYNVLGMQWNEKTGTECYPHSRFWKIASFYHNKAIIGMDAHQPRDLSNKLYKKALEELSKWDVEIVSTIKKVDFEALRREKKLKDVDF